MILKRWQMILLFIFIIGLGLRLVSTPAPIHPYYASNLIDTLVIAHKGG